MQKMSLAIQWCIQDFVTLVTECAAREISSYEQEAIAHTLFTILKKLEDSHEDISSFTKEREIFEGASHCEYRITGDEEHGALIKELFELAESVSMFVTRKRSIFNEIIDEDSKFFIFFDLIFLIKNWAKVYADESVEQQDKLPF